MIAQAATNQSSTQSTKFSPLRPRLVPIDHACAYSGFGRTKLYEELGKGNILASKHGRRTLINLDSVDRFIESLPAATFRSPA